MASDVTKDAASPEFNYYGRWQRGKVAVTIKSGAFVEFSAIQTAVRQMADPRITFLDYSSGVISTQETSDGCHLNREGAVRLAARVTRDLQDRLRQGESNE